MDETIETARAAARFRDGLTHAVMRAIAGNCVGMTFAQFQKSMNDMGWPFRARGPKDAIYSDIACPERVNVRVEGGIVVEFEGWG